MIQDKLFINLRILSKIPKNGRITRSSNGIVSIEHETVVPLALKRFLFNNSRKQSVFEINSIITECIDTLDSLSNSKWVNKPSTIEEGDPFYKTCEEILQLLVELESAKVGIINLKFTYINDINVVSQLDIAILKITTALKDYSLKLSHFKSRMNFNLKEIFENETGSQSIEMNNIKN